MQNIDENKHVHSSVRNLKNPFNLLTTHLIKNSLLRQKQKGKKEKEKLADVRFLPAVFLISHKLLGFRNVKSFLVSQIKSTRQK